MASNNLQSLPKLVRVPMKNRKLISHALAFLSGLVLGITLISFHRDYFRHDSQTEQVITLAITPIAPPKPAPAPPPEYSPSLRHTMEDEELLRRASRVRSNCTKKIAFMFLVRGDVALAPLWERFFKGHEGHYSVYVHSDPSFTANVSENSPFYGRWVPSKAVNWGQPNMGEAERRLLGNALLDPENDRFVLLSESCIPLFNFSTVYTYLTGTSKSFVEAYDEPGKTGRGRYNAHMNPLITPATWRKGSQWVTLTRRVAHAVVTDHEYFPLFQRFCWGICYTDEHYLPTFLSAELARESANRTLTWVDWGFGGAHPRRFVRGDVTNEFLKRMRHGSECEYEGRRSNLCHLFARKFLPNTLDRLLRFAPKVMHFH